MFFNDADYSVKSFKPSKFKWFLSTFFNIALYLNLKAFEDR